MEFKKSELSLRVRPNDLDALGHVNNAVYLEYLEAGRAEWGQANGLDANAPSIVPVVARIEIDYRRELRAGSFTVRTEMEPFAASDELSEKFRAVLKQSIAADGKTLAEARVHIAFIDVGSRAPLSVQDFLDQAAGKRS